MRGFTVASTLLLAGQVQYQVIELASEMNGPMTIVEIGWQRDGEYGSKTGYYSGFTI